MAEDEEKDGGGKRWWITAVLVPVAVALIGLIGVLIVKSQTNPNPHGGNDATTSVVSTTSSAASSTVQALPAADPVPDCTCFSNDSNLMDLGTRCQDGSMKACDILADQTAGQGIPIAHNYGVSCGGRRPPQSPQQPVADCDVRFPGNP
jgi:hypothetical protein